MEALTGFLPANLGVEISLQQTQQVGSNAMQAQMMMAMLVISTNMSLSTPTSKQLKTSMIGLTSRPQSLSKSCRTFQNEAESLKTFIAGSSKLSQGLNRQESFSAQIRVFLSCQSFLFSPGFSRVFWNVNRMFESV